MNDPTALPLHEAARLLRAGDLSPVELTRACLARIERLDPGLNAFITVTADAALAEARVAEGEQRRGEWRGPLHGIPVALKDLIDTAGVRTTAASALFAARVPERDAEVVRRLRAAGAVLLGKLNLHELAYGASSLVSHFGPVRNPRAPERIAGGSSSGAAAALAAGLCFGAVGTDTGGSIRQPAAYCGVVGLKPGFGRVSARGVIPLSPSLDHVGPMTRCVRDAALMLGALAGHDPGDPGSRHLPLADWEAALAEGVRGLRPGIPRAHFFEGLDPEIETAMDAALGVLTDLVGPPREVTLPVSVDTTILRAEAYAYYRQAVETHPESFQPETLRRLRAGAQVDAPTYDAALREVDRLRRGAGEVFRDVDLLVTPTTPVLPFALEETGADAAAVADAQAGARAGAPLRSREVLSLRNTRPFNTNGLPSISIPCGVTEGGIPIGMQLTGPPGGESAVLRVAHAYEARTGPGISAPGR